MLKPNKNLNQMEFDGNAGKIKKAHWNQSANQIENLNKKYKNIIFGLMEPWSFIEKLSLCIDPTDKELYCTNQWIHTLQVVESMENKKVIDEEFIVAGILHDFGKILLLTDELPENIVCDNGIVGEYKENIGWKNCMTNWNHDEFAYMKLKPYLSENYLWLIRYHSINLKNAYKYADSYDKKMIDKYILPFEEHDKLTKSIYNIPKLNLDKYKKIIEKHLPKKIEV